MVQVNACDNLTDWSTTNGVDALDNADKQEGTASIKITGDGTPITQVTEALALSSENWGGYDYIILWMKPQVADSAVIRVWTTWPWQDWIEWIVKLRSQLTDDAWCEATLRFDTFDGSNGTFDKTDINGVRFQQTQVVGGEIFWLDDIRVEADAVAGGAVGKRGLLLTL